MYFEKEILKEIVNDEVDHPDYEVIEQGDWINDHKYDFRETIFRYKDKFYSIDEGRSGSYFSEYYYTSEDWSDKEFANEVELKEITIKKWVQV